MVYETAKTLHLIGVVCWFGSLLYLVRLGVYHAQATEHGGVGQAEIVAQLELMQQRLWRVITLPSMLVALGAGSVLVWRIGTVPPWLGVKLVLVAGLLGYQGVCARILRDQLARTSRWESRSLRVVNEVGTAFLVSIVSLAVFKKVGAGLGLAVSLMVLMMVSGTLVSWVTGAKR